MDSQSACPSQVKQTPHETRYDRRTQVMNPEFCPRVESCRSSTTKPFRGFCPVTCAPITTDVLKFVCVNMSGDLKGTRKPEHKVLLLLFPILSFFSLFSFSSFLSFSVFSLSRSFLDFMENRCFRGCSNTLWCCLNVQNPGFIRCLKKVFKQCSTVNPTTLLGDETRENSADTGGASKAR